MMDLPENPYSPPLQSTAVSDLPQGETWRIGGSFLLLTLIVLAGLAASAFAFPQILTWPPLGVPLEKAEQILSQVQPPDERTMTGAVLLGLGTMAAVLWFQGVLLSIGGLISLVVGTLGWILCVYVIFSPWSWVGVWGLCVVVLILGPLLLPRIKPGAEAFLQSVPPQPPTPDRPESISLKHPGSDATRPASTDN